MSEVIVSADIFNTQPTCGELSCDECNERYAKAVNRIKSLEAERERLNELLKEYMETCGTCDFIMMPCDLCAKTKASIGGEGNL